MPVRSVRLRTFFCVALLGAFYSSAAPLLSLPLLSLPLLSLPLVTSLSGNTEVPVWEGSTVSETRTVSGASTVSSPVTVLGEHLQGASVWFGLLPGLEVQVNADGTRLSVFPPAGAGQAAVVIRTAAGAVIAGRYAWRMVPPRPVVRLLDLSPRRAAPGSRVTLLLAGDLTFSPLERVTPDLEVWFGGVRSPSVRSEAGNALSAEVPPGGGQVDVTLSCSGCYTLRVPQALPFDYAAESGVR